MSSTCTPILVGVVSSVSEILQLSKTAKFPFPTMDYSPWSSKNLIDRNCLKKFMQVCVDVTCMYINFGGRGLFSFGDTATLKNGQISLSNHGLYIVHGRQKIEVNRIGSKNSCKYGLMSSACTPILVGVVSLVSEIPQPSKTTKFPFPTMDYSPWSSKNLIDWNRLKKFMQVWIDVKYMHTNFGGCGLFGFGDTATLKNGQISLSDHGL